VVSFRLAKNRQHTGALVIMEAVTAAAVIGRIHPSQTFGRAVHSDGVVNDEWTSKSYLPVEGARFFRKDLH